ncbi:MAG: transporter substrate-binding domain-containing protein [Lactobacillus sp.]|jgi:polar amino acid transport system substrate-binding protein|nr:transporter substrate-binding domain-containing protein [Lactobacillus sp.]MCI2032350.1 transporter substrate-binding domain-containing protein [Lactobacillus sp.]
MTTKTTLLTLSTIALLALAAISAHPQAVAAKTKVETITVGTGGMPKPFTYETADGKLKGYDIDTLRAIDKKLPQYQFKYTKTDIPGVLGGVDSGRYQIGANNFGYNKERAEKYYFSKPIFLDQTVIVVRKNNTSIKSIADIGGKTTVEQAGVNYDLILKNFNKKHTSNQAKITYSSEDVSKSVQDISTGKYQFFLLDRPLYNSYIKTFKITNLKAIPVSTAELSKYTEGTSRSYFLFQKSASGKKLKKAIDKALVAVQKDGEQTAISKKYFDGNDYAPKP